VKSNVCKPDKHNATEYPTAIPKSTGIEPEDR
jgi:hypothetical protein